MEKKKVKTRPNDTILTGFIIVSSLIAFIGGYALSGEMKDRTYRASEKEEKGIVENDDIQIAAGGTISGSTLGFNENYIMSENGEYDHNIILGSYQGVNGTYYDIQYGDNKNEIAFIKYSYNEEDSEYNLIPFERNVVDIHMSTFDMDTELNTIFFLLDDGSVEYILIEDAIERNDFRSFGKLEGLNNIAKFYEGTTCETDSPVCTKTAFAQSTDGKIYDLYNYVH